VAKLWTQEQIKGLRDFTYEPIAGVKVCLIPISKGGRGQGYGSTIVWDKRVYRQGVMGPRELTASELEGCGVPREEAEKIETEANRALAMLTELYPVLLPRVEHLKAEIEASVKAIEAKAESLRQSE